MLAPNIMITALQVPGSYGSSPMLNFTMPPAVGTYPMTLGVIADVGQTSNSSQTWARMAAQNVQIATLVGEPTKSSPRAQYNAHSFRLSVRCLTQKLLVQVIGPMLMITSQTVRATLILTL